MNIPFTKMQALGNDFVVFDFTQVSHELSVEQAQHIADRHLGIGCDQILIVETSDQSDIDFKYRIINADGSEVAQCGNGARCFLKFVLEQGLSNKNSIRVATMNGVMTLELDPHSQMVKVEMGIPDFEPSSIPLAESERQSHYSINRDGDAIRFAALAIGNPHAVIQVEDVDHAPVALVGPVVESHPIFPQRANVGFMQIISPQHIALRVYERGAGETLACGSGACAAVVAGIQSGHLANEVQVDLRGGTLNIQWQGEGHPVVMTGAAHTSFHGVIKL